MQFYQQMMKRDLCEVYPALADDLGLDSIKEIANKINQSSHYYLQDLVRLKDWQTLMSMVDTKKQVFVICDNVPEDWPRPRNIKVINIHYWAWKTSHWMKQLMSRPSFAKIFKRHSSDLKYDFFFTLGNPLDMDRTAMVKYLHDMGLLGQAKFSSPTIAQMKLEQDADLYDSAFFPEINGRKLEDSNVPYEQMRNDKGNANLITSLSRQSGFNLVLDNEFTQARCGNVNEKALWPVLSQTPSYWIMSDQVKRQMEEWGFTSINKEFAPTGFWPRIKHHAKNIWNLKQIQQNKTWQQKWQDLQGEQIEKNRQALLRLDDRILEEVEAQLKSQEFSW